MKRSTASATATATPIHSAFGKVIGQVSDGVLRKRIRGSRHILHSRNAIAFDTYALAEAQRAGATAIAVEDIEAHVTYTISVHDFAAHAESITYTTPQLACPLPYWHAETTAYQLELGL